MRVAYYEPPWLPQGDPPQPAIRWSLWPKALERAGCDVSVWDGDSAAPNVDAWITAGLCPNAPDMLGLMHSRQQQVPYVLLEPRVAAGASENATDESKSAAIATVAQADAVLSASNQTLRSLRNLVAGPEHLVRLPAFAPLAFPDAYSQAAPTSSSAEQFAKRPARVVVRGFAVGDAGVADLRTLALALSRIVWKEWSLVVLCRPGGEQLAKAAFCHLPQPRMVFRSATHPEIAWRALVEGDVYLHASTQPADLETLLEAQVCRAAVVAVQSPDIADRVLDGCGGRLVKPNAEALANCVSFLIENPVMLDEFAQQAREYAFKHHDMSVVAAELHAFLSRATSSDDDTP